MVAGDGPGSYPRATELLITADGGLTANRCGVERGTEFFGWSQIVDPLGRRLAEAGADETVITAELNLELAREKTKEPADGGYHVSLFGDRRPELYSPLAAAESPLATRKSPLAISDS